MTIGACAVSMYRALSPPPLLPSKGPGDEARPERDKVQLDFELPRERERHRKLQSILFDFELSFSSPL